MIYSERRKSFKIRYEWYHLKPFESYKSQTDFFCSPHKPSQISDTFGGGVRATFGRGLGSRAKTADKRVLFRRTYAHWNSAKRTRKHVDKCNNGTRELPVDLVDTHIPKFRV